jgi:hypothetical protein
MRDSKSSQSRRSFIKKAAYIAPAVLTLKAMPAFASNGSRQGPKPKPQAKGKK